MIVTTDKDTKPWVKSFQAYNPNIEIEIYPNITNKEKITFALVWSKNDIDFKEFPNLKCIASMGAGVDHILCNKTISQNIAITKIVDTQLVSSMWEYLLTAVMNVVTNHYSYIQQQKQKNWNPIKPKPLNQFTIGILGLGQLGYTVAQNFTNMNFKVKGYAHSKKDIKNIKTYTILEEATKDTDILINLLPLTKETQGILDYHLFCSLKKGCYIINVGRGEHLIVEDLIQAIEEQKLSGATLDVFESKPLQKESSLWENDKITITPHSASITDPVSVTKQIMDNYERVYDGLEPFNKINRINGY
jgi:glyoxylate/hydroxypyruvate reductase A